MIQELKNEVEVIFGQKIEKRRVCEGLSADIYEKTGILISYNTIRRLYGLIPYREPRISTLDALSKYVGFSTFYDFSNRYHKVDDWPKWENIFLGINKSQAENLVEMFTYRFAQQDDFAYSFSVLLRELIYRRDLETLQIILSQKVWSFPNIPYNIALKIGVIVGSLFRFIDDEGFEKELLKIPLFRDLVLKMFVDYSRLNKKYGAWISYVNQLTDLDEESLIFTRGILIWRDLLNGQQISSVKLSELPELSADLHPILFGRIAALYLMLFEQEERDELLTSWKGMIQKQPDRTLEYIFVSNVQCLVFPTLQFSQFLASFEKQRSNIYFWYNLSQLNVYHLALVQHAIFIGEKKRARLFLQQIDLSYLRYGYDEFLLLFVYLFQLELSASQTEKNEIWQKLLDHANYLNYPIFTEDYFRMYFTKKPF